MVDTTSRETNDSKSTTSCAPTHVCSGAMFATCLAFLESSEPTAVPQCEQVYLGPDIGFASIMQYSDTDGTCTISLAELSTSPQEPSKGPQEPSKSS